MSGEARLEAAVYLRTWTCRGHLCNSGGNVPFAAGSLYEDIDGIPSTAVGTMLYSVGAQK